MLKFFVMFTRTTLTLFGMACVFDVSHINVDVFSPFISKTTEIRRKLLRYKPGYENRFQKTRNRPVHARPRELMFSCSRFYMLVCYKATHASPTAAAAA